ncbi:MAG: YsnF/AvaK domain-containing protein [Chloroflexi bacterium]|nr:YsnF/AvaK domain-containing protein [Chloroflexota bacterium]
MVDDIDAPRRLATPEEPAEADLTADTQTIVLHEERLVADKEVRHVGDVEIRTEVDEVPGRLEVDALREDVEVQHVVRGEVVEERQDPYYDGDELVVPVYEEQLVVSKRIILREELRIKRVPMTERQLFEDTLRRERLVVEDPSDGSMVHERYSEKREGLFDGLWRKIMTP